MIQHARLRLLLQRVEVLGNNIANGEPFEHQTGASVLVLQHAHVFLTVCEPGRCVRAGVKLGTSVFKPS